MERRRSQSLSFATMGCNIRGLFDPSLPSSSILPSINGEREGEGERTSHLRCQREILLGRQAERASNIISNTWGSA